MLAGLGVAAAAILVVLVSSLLGQTAQDRITEVAMLGRQEESAELTGRIPAWNVLAPYVSQRPWTGHGYESFWTIEHIDDIGEDVGWNLQQAHNQYLDAVLSVGLIGAAAILACAVLGVCCAASRLRQSGDYGYALILGLLVFSLVSGLTESRMLGPELEPLMVGCGLTMLAFARPQHKELDTA